MNWDPAAVGTGANFAIAIRNASDPANPRIPGSVDPNNPAIDTLGEKIFAPTSLGGQGWQVASHQPNDAEGFKASFFTNPVTGEKVLAIAGTEPGTNPYLDLLKADISEIGTYGMAITQAVSLFNYIRVLQAPKGGPVQQFELLTSYIVPPSGDYVTISVAPPAYMSMVPSSNYGVGLGLLDSTDDVTITGHSLGGHLAAIGNRLFPDLFDNAVTFNAPGFDATQGEGFLPIYIGKQLTDKFGTPCLHRI